MQTNPFETLNQRVEEAAMRITQPPSVGRIVHYTPYPPKKGPIAAIITAVYDDGPGGTVCALTLFPPGQASYAPNEAYVQGEPGEADTWCFPGRV